MNKSKGLAAIWIVLITLGATLLILGIIALAWYGTSQLNKAKELTKNQTTATKTPKKENNTSTAVPKKPTEEAVVAAENFLMSIFDTFPESKIDLTKAKTYLSSDLQSKVNNTKESYWDLHGYIHSGPCRILINELEKNDTTARIQISAEWGTQTCNITDPLPYYIYKMSNVNGSWKITEIEQLVKDEVQVPRDF